jgi:hypothetical protein
MLSKIDNSKYQVFILESGTAFPLMGGIHPWIVINKKGKLARYEIRHYLSDAGTYLHINAQPPFQGLPLIWPIQKFFQKTKLLKMVEGDENSRAKQLVDKIENSVSTYPYLNTYAFLGANCATYVAWVMRDFPEIHLKLPWNAFGKNFT